MNSLTVATKHTLNETPIKRERAQISMILRQPLLVFVPQRRHLEEEDFCSIPKIRLIPSFVIKLTL